MSKEELFDYYLLKNPALIKQLENNRVVLSAKGFRKIFDTTYDVAYKQGINGDPAFIDTGEEDFEEQYSHQPSSGVSLADLMRMFGMK